jgi:hypothetical protein
LRDGSPSAIVRGLIVGLLLLLAYCLALAARTGLADMYAAPAKSFLQAKRDAGEILSQVEWQGLYDSLTQALALAPRDPENLSELGRLDRIALEANDLSAADLSRHGKASASHYQAALALRPTWAWDWSDLALVKY